MFERFETHASNQNEDSAREEAFEQLKKRENELLKTNEAQIKLAQIFFPEEPTLEDMMMKWATSDAHYSDQFRKLLQNEPELLDRILNDDEKVVDEIANRFTQ